MAHIIIRICLLSFQSVIFHVEYHPKYPWFAQCVTFHFFPTPTHELAYNLFNIIAIYGLPLLVIVISYSLIVCQISKKTRETQNSKYPTLTLYQIDISISDLSRCSKHWQLFGTKATHASHQQFHFETNTYLA